MKRIADSTIRRLSLYLRHLEEAHDRGVETISSDELARRGGPRPPARLLRIERHRGGRHDHGRLLWQLLMLDRSLRRLFGLGSSPAEIAVRKRA